MICDFYSLGKNSTNLLNKFAVLKSLEYDVDFEREEYKKDKKIKNDNSDKKSIPLYPVIVNFNTEEDKIEIKYGKQEECEEYLCLEKDSPNGRKISFYTNNVVNHLTVTIPDIIAEIKEKFPDNKKLIEYLNMVLNKFFVKQELVNKKDKKVSLNIIDFNKIKAEDIKDSFLSLEVSTIDDYKKKINEVVVKKYFENNNRIFLIEIDGKHILTTSFKEGYVSILYEYKLGKLLDDNTTGTCHICNTSKKILNGVKFPLTFYNTDKEEFFNNLNIKHSTKSFSICGDCYIFIISGMKYLENISRKNKYSGVPFMIIPKTPKHTEDYNYVRLKLTEQLGSTFKKTVEKLEKSKLDDLTFSILFYNKKQSSFKIIREIDDLSYFNIRKINKLLESTNNGLLIIDYDGNENYFGLGDIKNILYSNSKFKDENIIKELLEIINAVYSNLPIAKSFLLNQILLNYKKNYYDKYTTSNFNNLLKSHLFIQFLIKNNNLEMMKMQIETYTKIQNKELLEFFDKNQNLNKIEQGLITFGFLINKIIYAQNEKSSTFIKKVGFDGLDVHDLKELFSELEEYREIYKINKFDNAETSFISEIISKIQKDNISPTEINYYILFGIELGKYIGIKMSKKINQGEKNE